MTIPVNTMARRNMSTVLLYLSVLISLAYTVDAKRGYILTAPKVFLAGSAEKVCVDLYDISTNVNVQLKITSLNNAVTHMTQAKIFYRGRGSCVDLEVPRFSAKEAMFHMSLSAPSISYSSVKSQKIGIMQNNTLIFVQTNKPIYKPEQTVRFRVLSLLYNLKPLAEPVPKLYIENPTKIRMMQWNDVAPRDGMINLDMDLSKEPVLGTWKIVVEMKGRTHIKTFEVKEYVLPKYEVIVKPPPFVVVTDTHVTGEICAKYTYGKPVNGRVTITVCRSGPGNSKPCHSENKAIKGCVPFNVSAVALKLQPVNYDVSKSRLSVTAEVTEDGTGVALEGSDNSTAISLYPLILRFESPDYFKPGLPYYGRVTVTKPDGSPALYQLVTVDLPVAGNTHQKANFTSGGTGVISFQILEMQTLLNTASYRAFFPLYSWSPKLQKTLKRWYSPSGRYLQIIPIYVTGMRNDRLQIDIKFTAKRNERLTFNYEVVSLGNIVYRTSRKFTSVSVSAQSYRYRLRIRAKMSPKAHILVYYVASNGEVVADSTEFDVEEFLQNKVELSFTPNNTLPGASTVMKLKADPDSICAVNMLDKSVLLLGGDELLKVPKVISILRGYQLNSNTGPHYPDKCAALQGSHFYDSQLAFKKMGMFVLTDLTVETKPCKWRPTTTTRAPVIHSRGKSRGGMAGIDSAVRRRVVVIPRVPATAPPPPPEPEEEDIEVEVRDHFPETWLWDVHIVSNELEKTHTLPDTITEWVGNAFCTNYKSGLGVSKLTKVKTFKPFFVSFTLPYSVIRGEHVHLPVTVFSYLPDWLVIKLELKTSPEYDVIGPNIVHICVGGNEPQTVLYEVMFKNLGQVNISIQGVSITAAGVCGNNLIISNVIGATDAVIRPILVEPEGRKEEYSFSELICVEDDLHTTNINLSLPSNLVPDSARADITVIGDLMGPTLDGLGKLLIKPSGCAEQNLAKFAPNVYVLQYLTKTYQLENMNKDYKQKALAFMKIGYQNQVKKQHSDGSYGLYYRSHGGNTWLTAFTIKTFAQAFEYIPIDQNALVKSINWLKSSQLANGCFQKKGKFWRQTLSGGMNVEHFKPAALTSYILMALLEAGVPKADPVVKKAINCLNRQTVTDAYTLALMTYTYTLWNDASSMRAALLNKLNNLAIVNGDMKYWSRSTTPPPAGQYPKAASIDIEMTAYALLAYVSGRSPDLIGSMPIAKWLTMNRNPHGGFSSTQDTVVAIQAIAAYALLKYTGDIDVSVAVVGRDVDHIFYVDDESKLVLQHHPIPMPNQLTVEVDGYGCAVVQANVRYNDATIYQSLLSSFQLTVAVKENSNCKIRTITICTRFTVPNANSNMALVETRMVSGWTPQKQSLLALLKNKSVGIKRYEVDLETATFYFHEITAAKKCFHIQVEQYIKVTSAKPGVVQVSDYYETAYRATTPYNIQDSCQ